MDRSRHSITQYTDDGKTRTATNKKFKRLGLINYPILDVELTKHEIEHEELTVVGFFILQYANLRILQIYYKFFTKF